MNHAISNTVTCIFLIILFGQNVINIAIGFKKIEDINATKDVLVLSIYLSISGIIGIIIIAILFVSAIICKIDKQHKNTIF